MIRTEARIEVKAHIYARSCPPLNLFLSNEKLGHWLDQQQRPYSTLLTIVINLLFLATFV